MSLLRVPALLVGLLLALWALPALADGLPAPQGLRVSPASGPEGQTTLVLQWEPVPGAFGYEVFMFKAGQWDLDEDDTDCIPMTASTRIGGLDPDTPYEFRVRAVGAGGAVSPMTAAVGARTVAVGSVGHTAVTATPPAQQRRKEADVAGPAPDAPSSAIGVFADSDTINLSWRKVAGASHYRVEEEKDGKWVEIPDANGGLPQANRTVLKDHPRPGPFRFRISAVGANGRMSEPSLPVTVLRD